MLLPGACPGAQPEIRIPRDDYAIQTAVANVLLDERTAEGARSVSHAFAGKQAPLSQRAKATTQLHPFPSLFVFSLKCARLP